LMASNTSDPYLYTGLYQDTEYGGHAAWYRNYSAEQSRWLTPDPYNGSYDLMNPQSLNRYMYVNGNPLGYTDPSGLAGGVTGWGGVCTAAGKMKGLGFLSASNDGGFNPCNPVSSVIALAIVNSSLNVVPNFIADSINSELNSMFNSNLSTSVEASAIQIAAYVNAGFTIACSIDNFNSAMCGPSGLTSLIPGAGGDVGKGVGDGIAVATAISCSMGGLSNPVCDGFVVYNIANSLYSIFDSLFNGPAQFTGSLLPRPSDLGGLGTSPIGIPNQNLSIRGILGQPSSGTVPSPGMRQ
jgi:RHS repeat-associated protein